MLKLLLNAPLEHLRRTDIDNAIKTLHVLEYICRAENDCSVSDIVSNFDVDKFQVIKWLEVFVESGYIKKDQKTDRYYPTLKTVALGNCIVNNIRARNLTSAEITQRCSRVEESAQISVCDTNISGIVDNLELKTDRNG